jgi:hypothetical protein
MLFITSIVLPTWQYWLNSTLFPTKVTYTFVACEAVSCCRVIMAERCWIIDDHNRYLSVRYSATRVLLEKNGKYIRTRYHVKQKEKQQHMSTSLIRLLLRINNRPIVLRIQSTFSVIHNVNECIGIIPFNLLTSVVLSFAYRSVTILEVVCTLVSSYALLMM